MLEPTQPFLHCRQHSWQPAVADHVLSCFFSAQGLLEGTPHAAASAAPNAASGNLDAGSTSPHQKEKRASAVPSGRGVMLISEVIRATLHLDSCAVVMGANVANEIAAEKFSEASIGCRDPLVGLQLKRLLEVPSLSPLFSIIFERFHYMPSRIWVAYCVSRISL